MPVAFRLLGLLPAVGHGLYDAVHRIESARIYGNIDAFAYYFVDLIIGTPPQRVSVILDTGSGVVAFPCASCTHCGKHIDPAFDFAKSSTAAWAPCDRSCAGRCDRGKCTYYQGYTEGSSISGFWFKDYVRLGDAIQHNPPVIGRMGCHQNENNLFYTQRANGILGIGPMARSGGRTLLQALFGDKAHVEPQIFSICLAEWGGRLSVGGYNASYHTGPIRYVPLSLSTGYYGVGLTAMKVAGKVVASRFGRVMIDSGTTFTYMGSRAYRGLRDSINSYCQRSSNCGALRRAGNCFTVPPGPEGLAGFPDVEVQFGWVSTTWVPKAYMSRKVKSNTWCFTFKDDGANANTVLGASWMIHQEIIFDLRTSRVGIAKANCPEFRDRPYHPPNLTAADLAPPSALATGAASTHQLAWAHTSLRSSTTATPIRPGVTAKAATGGAWTATLPAAAGAHANRRKTTTTTTAANRSSSTWWVNASTSSLPPGRTSTTAPLPAAAGKHANRRKRATTTAASRSSSAPPALAGAEGGWRPNATNATNASTSSLSPGGASTTRASAAAAVAADAARATSTTSVARASASRAASTTPAPAASTSAASSGAAGASGASGTSTRRKRTNSSALGNITSRSKSHVTPAHNSTRPAASAAWSRPPAAASTSTPRHPSATTAVATSAVATTTKATHAAAAAGTTARAQTTTRKPVPAGASATSSAGTKAKPGKDDDDDDNGDDEGAEPAAPTRPRPTARATARATTRRTTTRAPARPNVRSPPGAAKGQSATPPQGTSVGGGGDPARLLGAGTAVLLSLGLCLFGVRRLRRSEQRGHVQLKDNDDSGMPPQIVGAAGGNIAGADTFVIGDDDDECEALFEEGEFNFDFSGDSRPSRSPSPPADRGTASPQRSSGTASASNKARSQGSSSLGGDIGAMAPVFAGPAQAKHAFNLLD